MAIVPMTGFGLMAPEAYRERLLQALQRFGQVHFKSLADGDALPDSDTEVAALSQQRDDIRACITEVEKFEKASRHLLGARGRRALFRRDMNMDSLSFDELEARAREIDIDALLAVMNELAEDERAAEGQVLSYIEPWAKQKLDDAILVEIRDSKPIIGTVAADQEERFAQELRGAGQIYTIMRKHGEDSTLFILKPSAEQAEAADILAEKYHMKRRSAGAVRMGRELLALRRKINKMISRRHRTDGSLEKLAQRKMDLMIYYEYLAHKLLRIETSKKFLHTDSMVIVEGWIPTNRADDFAAAADAACDGACLLNMAPAQKTDEDTPVMLKNNYFSAAFESVTNMYATPRYNEIDPTPVFAPFYLLFFGMMLADAGYGALMAVVTLVALRLFTFKPSMQLMLRFGFFLSLSTIGWGLVYGSCFGGLIPLPALIDMNSEYTRILLMSMAFGIAHLFVGLGVKAYIYIRDGHMLYALFDTVFWYMLLIPAIALVTEFMAPGLVPAIATYSTPIWAVFIAGAAGIIFTNGRAALTLPGKLASGFYSLYGITGYVSDVVSYSRLMALGLAGGSIGLAVTMMVQMVGGGIVGFLGGAAIFLVGTGMNLFINGLSAYVHSSRLIYVEFFSKFFTGGGVAFTSFRAKTTYINIT